MNRIKLFEDFKNNNIEGKLISQDDIIKCIKYNGVLFATIINGFPGNDPKSPLKPLSIDDDGLVTIDIDGEMHEIALKNIKKIEY